jgi:1-acyl-sn-glycerol-3-phosphate acyltransferase
VSDGTRTRTEEQLSEALADLRREIRARLPALDAPEDAAPETGASIDWFALFDELRVRLNTFGMQERTGEIDEFGMDEMVVRRAQPLLEFLRRRYWRVEVSGSEEIPSDGPALFVANRSGLLPWDGLMLAHVVARAHPRGEHPRFMVADWLITLPFVQPYLARLGGVRACRENAQRLLGSGRSVVAFPEGVKGAAKVYRERYRVQRFGRGGVVRLAIEAGVPIVPVCVIGAEEVHPILFKLETVARGFGLPFLPVTPTFPWLGPLGAVPLPSKWSVRFGPRLDAESLGREAASDELLIARLNDELRQAIQTMLDVELRRREATPA